MASTGIGCRRRYEEPDQDHPPARRPLRDPASASARSLGRQWVAGFTILALAMNVGAYFFSDKIVLRMHRAQPVAEAEAPRLYAIVRELAMRAEIPMPRVFLIPSPQPNAFATGRNPEHGVVAVTDGILQLLTERELRGVLAHEIGHIKNRDILVSTIAAAVAGAIAYIAQHAAVDGDLRRRMTTTTGRIPIGALALAIVAPIAATLVQLGISRSREYLADETGAALSGDPEALAGALENSSARRTSYRRRRPQPATASLFIVNPFAGARGMANLFSTHPPMARAHPPPARRCVLSRRDAA